MATGEDYWKGTVVPNLTIYNSKGKWVNYAGSIDFVSLVLQKFAKFRSNASNHKDKDAELAKTKLDEAGKQTFDWSYKHGTDVSNLYRFLYHVGGHQGGYDDPTDDGNCWYEGYTGSPIKTGSQTNLPVGVVSFVYAINKQAAEVEAAIRKHQSIVSSPSTSSIAETVKAVKENAERAAPLLYLVPGTQKYESLVNLKDKGLGYLDLVGKITDAINAGNQQFTLQTGNKALVMTGFQVGLSYIPIFGEYYAAAAAALPTLEDWAHNTTLTKVDMLAKILGKQAGEIFPGWQK